MQMQYKILSHATYFNHSHAERVVQEKLHVGPACQSLQHPSVRSEYSKQGFVWPRTEVYVTGT